MIVPFLYELRSREVPVGAQEAVMLADALGQGLHESTLTGFYHVARSLLIHSEAHLDAFDQAFMVHFHKANLISIEIHKELLEWLKNAADRPLPDGMFDDLDPGELLKMLEERIKEQKERHDGGNYWVGTRGSSPFGNSGLPRPGIRVGGKPTNRSAFRTADARNFAGYRNDLTLDVRQTSMALRKLRSFAREGSEQELDLDGTISATARNAGELEVVTRPPRRPNTRVILMMDVGGSMDPFVERMEQLFSATAKASHFKEFRPYYFHNCIYGRVYQTESLRDPIPVSDLLRNCGRNYKLILVGDALMAPYELMASYGDHKSALEWMAELAGHFDRTAWINPESLEQWKGHPTLTALRQLFPMYPLTLDGLGQAVTHLTGGRSRFPI